MQSLLLAAGIGLNAALLSYVGALTAAWPSSAEPSALMEMTFQSAHLDGLQKRYVPGSVVTLSTNELLLFQQRQHVFDDVARSWDVPVTLDLGGAPSDATARVVTGSYFSVLRLHMALGSGLPREDERGITPRPFVVVSYRFWQARLAGVASAIGTTISVNDNPMMIVGVMPRGFRAAADVWVPYTVGGLAPVTSHSGLRDPWVGNNFGRLPTSTLRDDDEEAGGSRGAGPRTNGTIIARLSRGVTLDQAQSTATVTAIHITADSGDRIRATRLSSSPSSADTPNVFGNVDLLSLISILVLLVACVNASILLLGRAMTRRREIAVRLSLGADRRRVIRQLLTESILLAVIAADCGLLLLFWASAILWVRYPAIPVDLAPSWVAIAETTAFAVLTGVLFGLVPALHATRVDVGDALKEGADGVDVRRARLQRGMVVAEVALSMMIVCATGLFVNAKRATMAIDGAEASPLTLVTDVDLPAGHYTASRATALFEQARARLGRLPGVTSVVFANEVLLRDDRGRAWGHAFVPYGRHAHRPGFDAEINLVDPGYFAAMRHPLREGRDLTTRDAPGALLTAVVSSDLADSLWPRGHAIGQTLTVWKDTGVGPCGYSSARCLQFDTLRATVVGVTTAAHRERLGREATYTDDGGVTEGPASLYLPVAERTIYFARPQWADSGRMSLIVETSRADPRLPAAIEHVLRTLDPRLPFTAVVNAVDYQRAPYRDVYAAMDGVALMGSLVLLLACVGIYAVIAFNVAQHTREIGIRLALGARAGQVVALFFRDGFWLSLIGSMIGVLLALFIMKITVATTFGTAMLAPSVVGAYVALLLVVAAVASWLPARRAAGVDPLMAMRSD